MASGSYGRFTVFDTFYTPDQSFSNFTGSYTFTLAGPAIGPSLLEEAGIFITSTVLREPSYHFDVAVVTGTAIVSGAASNADIVAEIPSNAIITSVIQRAQFNVSAAGDPDNGFGAGAIHVEAPADTGDASFSGTYTNTFAFSRELVPPDTTVDRTFLLSDPIRKWALTFRPSYGWPYAGGAGLPDGITGTLTASVEMSVDYTVIYTQPPPPNPPAQSSVTVSNGSVGGGTLLDVIGTDFVATPTVMFGATLAPSVTWIDAQTVRVVTPAHAAGTVNVVVTNPDTQVCTLPLSFTYDEPAGDVLSCDQVVLELVYDAAIYAPFAPPDDWPPLVLSASGGGSGILRGPGECAGVGYGIGVIGGPGGIAGTGDPMSTMAIDLKQFFGGINPPSLGFLYPYAAGTLTPQDTFANSSLATANVWPIQLDADGNSPTPIFLGPFIYKFDLQDAAHVSLSGFPKDNIAGSVWPGQVLGAVTVNPIANADGIGHRLSSTLNKAASGTHALFAGFYVQAPTIGGGAGTLTEAASVYVAGAPGGGSARYAVHVQQGDLLLTDDASNIGFFGATPVPQQLVPTGSSANDIITALQALGLFKQA